MKPQPPSQRTCQRVGVPCIALFAFIVSWFIGLALRFARSVKNNPIVFVLGNARRNNLWRDVGLFNFNRGPSRELWRTPVEEIDRKNMERTLNNNSGERIMDGDNIMQIHPAFKLSTLLATPDYIFRDVVICFLELLRFELRCVGKDKCPYISVIKDDEVLRSDAHIISANVRDHRWLAVARLVPGEERTQARGVTRVAIRWIALFGLILFIV